MRLALTALLTGCAAGPGSGVELIGDRAPDFALEDQNGREQRLSDQAGSVVVLDFAAMWCLRCRDAAVELQALHEDRAADGVVVWSVLFDDVDGDDPGRADLNEWIETWGLTHDVLADRDEETFEAWGAGHQPVIFVIDGDRVVTWTDDGPGHTEEIEAAIDAALGDSAR